ncbi:hypothetical protein NLG97_g3672 [Lecanicillium saksenae]|uniref:Uncharacterized protein n=1 Tax=Lecanicillium saksenae TaxID=468837 RepID=A0ACC1QXF1_9HYPO|nr:hypothetical protein NLG97_g3672 [Lecanicillium saksenae]
MDKQGSPIDRTLVDKALIERYPEYASTTFLDELRTTEYSFLDQQNHVYLDYTGAGLAASAQHRAHCERFKHATFGNPHSSNPTSRAATELVDEARERVLQYFSASPDEYTVVFTPNATGAARLVGESYPWHRGTRLVLTADNHNSLNGLRQFAQMANHAQFTSQSTILRKSASGRRTWWPHCRGGAAARLWPGSRRENPAPPTAAAAEASLSSSSLSSARVFLLVVVLVVEVVAVEEPAALALAAAVTILVVFTVDVLALAAARARVIRLGGESIVVDSKCTLTRTMLLMMIRSVCRKAETKATQESKKRCLRVHAARDA